MIVRRIATDAEKANQHTKNAAEVAKFYAKDQASLDRILEQFSPEMKKHVLKRLLPHLKFIPKPLR